MFSDCISDSRNAIREANNASNSRSINAPDFMALAICVDA